MAAFDHVAIVIGVFVLMNAFCVAAEFALISAPRAAIEHRAGQGDALAGRLLKLITSPAEQDRYIATAQLGITAASLGLGMYGEHEIALWLGPRLSAIPLVGAATAAAAASVLAIAGLTFVHVIFGEMVPKSAALQRAEPFARVVYWPMRVVFLVLYPIAAVLGTLGRLCLRLVGVRRETNVHEHFHTPEELQLVVEESARGGALGHESSRLLRELFEFGDLTAGQVMVPRVRVAGLPLGAPPEAIRAFIAANKHARYPVYQGDLDHIAGMVHIKDLLRRLIDNEPVSATGLRPMPVVPTTMPLDDVLTTMQRAKAHVAVVIDEHGGTAGLVSLEDLFEEVVGELDELDGGTLPIVPESDSVVRVAGTVRLDELGQHFHIDLAHEDVESVSGVILAMLGRPPVAGDVVDYGRMRFEVLSISGRGARLVRASLQPDT